MRFLVEWSKHGGIEGPWEQVGVAEARGDDACFAAVSAVGSLAGLYRVRSAETLDEPADCYSMDAGRRIERRYLRQKPGAI
jgi:hypothetical protein